MVLLAAANKKKTLSVLALLAIDACMFTLVNPHKAPSIVVIGGFLLLVVTFYVIFSIFLEFVTKLFGLHGGRRKKLALFTTVCVAVLIGMQSIGQLDLRDLFAIVPLVGVLYFYLSYYGKQKPEKNN